MHHPSYREVTDGFGFDNSSHLTTQLTPGAGSTMTSEDFEAVCVAMTNPGSTTIRSGSFDILMAANRRVGIGCITSMDDTFAEFYHFSVAGWLETSAVIAPLIGVCGTLEAAIDEDGLNTISPRSFFPIDHQTTRLNSIVTFGGRGSLKAHSLPSAYAQIANVTGFFVGIVIPNPAGTSLIEYQMSVSVSRFNKPDFQVKSPVD